MAQLPNDLDVGGGGPDEWEKGKKVHDTGARTEPAERPKRRRAARRKMKVFQAQEVDEGANGEET